MAIAARHDAGHEILAALERRLGAEARLSAENHGRYDSNCCRREPRGMTDRHCAPSPESTCVGALLSRRRDLIQMTFWQCWNESPKAAVLLEGWWRHPGLSPGQQAKAKKRRAQ